MTTVTVEALASFGSGPIPDAAARTKLFLLCGSPSPGSLERCDFEFIDGQELKPGARGAIRMTFSADRLPPLSGPLAVWAGRIVGHIWGLHTVYRAQPDGPPARPRTEASTGPCGRHEAQSVDEIGPPPSARRPLRQRVV